MRLNYACSVANYRVRRRKPGGGSGKLIGWYCAIPLLIAHALVPWHLIDL